MIAADDVVANTNLVLQSMGTSERSMVWPEVDQYVLTLDSGPWILRELIEGKALQARWDWRSSSRWPRACEPFI